MNRAFPHPPPAPLARRRLAVLTALALTAGLEAPAASAFFDPAADREALPVVPPGFTVSFFAREPLVRQPCSLAFDARGRLFVGMGPQYRNPKPETPGDTVALVLDTDGDGRADAVRSFATGFNAIQGLAWHGRDLWVANAPDLTVVRDLDGDDAADEYVRIYTDLGNLEHGLHGLNWAPDGRLYFSKGNSKGLTEPGRVAPKPFRDLWGVTAPPGTPDFPAPQTFTRETYRHAYHDPSDDWGREGGVLRCEDGGKQLEIVARGFRNPWDITLDSGFNWLGTDNDQTGGDRVFMPFFGAHFGWNHAWSSHWSTEPHAPTAPVSGPLFEGSGTGVIFADSPAFPSSHRGVFFVNDWLRKTTFLWRPRWDGALMRPQGDWEPFVRGGSALFRPTDLEIGPDGALWILGWSSGYGAEWEQGNLVNEGRIFRVATTNAPPATPAPSRPSGPVTGWTTSQLIADLGGLLPVWRIDAQDELVRRGTAILPDLRAMLDRPPASELQETWALWTLGRIAPADTALTAYFESQAAPDSSARLNRRIQAVRILADRQRRAGNRTASPSLVTSLAAPEVRQRFAAAQALAELVVPQSAAAVREQLAVETDPTTYYALWQALRRVSPTGSLKPLLTDSRPGVRAGALLALLEDQSLSIAEVRPLAGDRDPRVNTLAADWLAKNSAGGEKLVVRGRPLAGPSSPPAASLKPAAGPPTPSLVSGFATRSRQRYQWIPGGLVPGAEPYTDRRYTLRRVPENLMNAEYLQTSNNDDGSRGPGWITFTNRLPTRVFIALDARAKPPQWLRDGFQRTNLVIAADHWNFELYHRDVPAGGIELGANTDDGRAGGKGNYLVILEMLPLVPPARPVTMADALGGISQADGDRGRLLFHHPAGAGCFHCHQLENHGNRFGPDLATVGERATARHLVQSMLEPSAVITEGFNLHTIITADDEVAGMLIEESGLGVTLGLATGERRTVPTRQIRSRRSAPVSAMPSYAPVLSATAVADLAAYLAVQRTPAAPARNSAAAPAGTPPAAPSTAPSGFTVVRQGQRLQILLRGVPIAEFLPGDERILRPAFANLRAVDGTPVTRSHPPVPGRDATDHDTMHPGLWLAFGDINGQDFWRNRGRMEQTRFLVEPRATPAGLAFATENRLLAATGTPLGHLTNQFLLTERPAGWRLVWTAIFAATTADLTFGDQEEMGFGARVATPFTEKNGGRILTSEGLRGARTSWGRAADWCDYAGTMGEQETGILLMASPGNFRRPWWHNRDYGVFVANPFGRSALKQGPPSAVVVPRGQSLRLEFAAEIHHTRPGSFDPATAWRDYSTRSSTAP